MHVIKPILSLLNVEPPQQIALLDAAALAQRHVPTFPPDAPALLGGLEDWERWKHTVEVLLRVYPAQHVVSLAWETRAEKCTLGDLLGRQFDTLPEWLYVPALAACTSFEAFQEVIAHLRAPDGCPWDREQTHLSLRTYLLEEAYEAIAALDANDPLAMREEFGDLLLQIVLHAQIAAESEEFRMADILRIVNEKLIRRHPHVFGDLEVDGVGAVLQNWETLKAEERKSNGQSEKGLLDGIPAALPALVQALEYQKRAARVGFDWPNADGILDKICEEAAEVRQAGSDVQRAAEIGDLLFALVNLARFYHVDAESVLRETNARFRSRFKHIESFARQNGKTVADLSLQEMDAIWEAAKTEESTQ